MKSAKQLWTDRNGEYGPPSVIVTGRTRDVPDIRFRFLLAGYPAVFFYPVPIPVEMVPGTGYLYRIVKLFEMDGTL